MHVFKFLFRKSQTVDKEILRAFAVFAVMLCVGIAVYVYTEGWSIMDAAYFSVITLTTVGYGDMHPTTVFSKLFTMGYVLFGVGLVFYLFTALSRHLFEDEKKEIHRIEHEISELEKLLREKRGFSSLG